MCEDVRLVDVADKVGTPAYVYSRAAIDDAQAQLHRGLGSLPHTLCFAVKSNGNLAILKHIAKAGNGFDIVSGGELEMLRMIGVRGDRIVFSGVGKKREEIREALQYRVAGNRKSQSGMGTGAAFFSSTLNRKQSSKFCSKRRHEAWGVAANRLSFRFV